MTDLPPSPPESVPSSTSAEIVEAGPSAKRKVRVPTFVVGLLAVALVGGLVGRGLFFGDGGASSPEDAVRQLGAAISSEDLVGALAALAPDEVRDAADTYTTASSKLASLGVTPRQKTLAGIDLDVSGLELKTTTLGPDVAKVEITGGKFSYKVSEQNLGPRVQQVIQKGDPLATITGLDDGDTSKRKLTTTSGSADLTHLTYRDADDQKQSPFLIAVQRDGGWYVSPFYTVAEVADSATGSVKGNFATIQPGPAATSPTGAVDQLIAAINRRDVDAGIDSLSADEWAVLRTYRAAIHADVDKAIRDSSPNSFQIDHQRLTGQPINDQSAKVFIESISGHVMKKKTERVDWSYADGCLKVDDPDNPFDSCSTKVDDSEGALDRLSNPVDIGGGTFGLDGSNIFGGAKSATGSKPYLVVVAERGGWAVSPVATLMTWFKAGIERLDANTLARLTGSELDTAPSGTATAGQALKLTLNSGGFATFAYRATAGSPFRVSVDGSELTTLQVRDPQGRESTFQEGGIGFARLDGTYRVVVTGTAGTSVSVTVAPLDSVPAISMGQSTTLHFGKSNEEQVVRVTVQPGQKVLLVPSGGSFDVYSPLGKRQEDKALTTSQAAATYYVLVRNRPNPEFAADGGSSDSSPPDVTLQAADASTTVVFEHAGPSITVSLDAPTSADDSNESDGFSGFDDYEYVHVPAGVAASVHVAPDPSLTAQAFIECGGADTFDDSADPVWVGGNAPGQAVDLAIPASATDQECDVSLHPLSASGSVALTVSH